MITKSAAVIGLGFGDEGKGVLTNYLCSETKDPKTVVRFSGGHQAGHTVIHNSIRHVFSNFGSGSLQGVPTIWSKFCTVDPVGILNELKVLRRKEIEPKLYLDPNCPVTTPYDKIANMQSKDNVSHGSCGVGFGKTIEREERMYSLKVSDLKFPSVVQIKLDLIRQYYHIDKLYLGTKVDEFLLKCNDLMSDNAISLTTEYKDESIHIYEGSQGLLLDQNIGFFPHVTRSNTGTPNLRKLGAYPELYLVTRAYQTRHGNGPMTNEGISHNVIRDLNETNQTHDYQGIFKISMLDADLLKYAISRDEGIRDGKFVLAITCVEHIHGNYQYTKGGKILEFENYTEFGHSLRTLLGASKCIIFANHVPVAQLD